MKPKTTILSIFFVFCLFGNTFAQDGELTGDANCDGAVNVLDVITISQYFIGHTPDPFCFENADVNGDGVINILDIIGTVAIFTENDDETAGTFTDPRDGQEYQWVQIGQQRWMAENLNYYTPEGSWYYDTDSLEYAASYGRLYTWTAAMNGASSSNDNPSGVQGICPPGWHLPSDSQWQQLIDYLGSDGAANKLKEEGTEHWQSTNEGVTNETGFTARPGGRRLSSGLFQSIGSFGLWWSTKERANNPDEAWTRYMLHNSANVTRFSSAKPVGISVRCIEN